MNRDIRYMKLALKEAKKAELIDEVPIGCVIVKDDKVIARGFNRRESKRLVISHAEIEAINKANKVDNGTVITVKRIVFLNDPINFELSTTLAKFLKPKLKVSPPSSLKLL